MPTHTLESGLQEALGHHQQGRLKRAEALYRQSLRLWPNHADTLHLLGLVRHQLGHAAEGHALVTAALAQQPTNPVYLNNLGEICRALGKPREALSCFEQAIRHHPGQFTQALRNLGRARHESGDTAGAFALFEEMLEQHPEDASTCYALAELLIRQKCYDKALTILDRGIDHSSQHVGLLCLKGITLRANKQDDQALAHYSKALRDCPNQAELHHNLGLLYRQLGRTDEALACFEHELSLQPSESTRHLVAALKGMTTSRAPAAYVRETFDAYAEQFDTHLVDTLAYRTPELLASLLPDTNQHLSILDLGCGTGLMGAALHTRKKRLVGLDLSPRMIEKARTRALYDELIVTDLLDWLASEPLEKFDLVVAADVLNYIGDLNPLFSCVHKIMTPTGLLLFSIESADDNTTLYKLGTNGRYQHVPEQLAKLATGNRFRIVKQASTVLRKEMEQDVPGELFLLELAG